MQRADKRFFKRYIYIHILLQIKIDTELVNKML